VEEVMVEVLLLAVALVEVLVVMYTLQLQY